MIGFSFGSDWLRETERERERGVSFIHQSQSKDKQKNKQSQIIFDIQLKIALTARLVIGYKAQTDV